MLTSISLIGALSSSRAGVVGREFGRDGLAGTGASVDTGRRALRTFDSAEMAALYRLCVDDRSPLTGGAFADGVFSWLGVFRLEREEREERPDWEDEPVESSEIGRLAGV